MVANVLARFTFSAPEPVDPGEENGPKQILKIRYNANVNAHHDVAVPIV